MSANLKQMSIDQMATMALRDAKDNYERAADLLLSWIKRDKQLYAEFIEPIERDAAMSRPVAQRRLTKFLSLIQRSVRG